ncbi:hypothetical protein BT96DRAFT_1016311 [Gymnopus androsaceus JB14]|uniref:Uncharacterized protein n=1 Tax=Gymnopus androsaceus JB14 TaxID=1447944 RepID=A0A6A4I175_9AGAR|nr:hypothetical protein BT96DRAFT_1016311 [Gymnopus androsaceus JB14]
MPSFMEIAWASLSSDTAIVNLQRGIFFGAMLFFVSFLAYKSQQLGFSDNADSNAVPTSEKNQSKETKEREWGEWTPVKFSYPSVTPSLNPMNMKPVPYRPFRWGAYHVTMGIRDMPWNEWIELDNQLASYYYIKKHRIATRGTNVVRVLPDRPGVVKSASHAAIELVHELADYLSKRYPDTFTVSRSAWGHISSITIVPVNETLDLPPPLVTKNSLELRQVSIEEAEHAMRVSALLVQDDLVLMVEGADGQYYFQGGAICLPGFWRMRDKIGMSLEEIHIQGHVPQYETKLHNSMNRYFKRAAVDKPIVRNNYFFQVIPPKDIRRPVELTSQSSAEPVFENDGIVDPEELAWSATTNGFEERFTHGNRSIPDKPVPISTENLRLRTERQSLRRLPLSGAIAFTAHTYVVPLEDLAKEPGIPARLASAIRSWPEDVLKYKRKEMYEKVMLDYLDKAAEEQRLAGGEELYEGSWKEIPILGDLLYPLSSNPVTVVAICLFFST